MFNRKLHKEKNYKFLFGENFFVDKYEVKVWVRLSDPYKRNGVK